MDEAWLAAGVVEQVLEAAARLGASPTVPIRRIRVLIGGLHGVDPYSFELGFRVASRGTPAADADLELLAVPVRVRCVACGARRSAAWEGGWDIAACRVCWSLGVDVSGGDQLRVDVVELGDGRVAQG
ncbi:MAG TPA: hydrogenase maturation nickel metallochaperone HypA [Candidatus Limnocylindrales bacterium]